MFSKTTLKKEVLSCLLNAMLNYKPEGISAKKQNCEQRIRRLFISLQKNQTTMPVNKNALIRYKYLDRLLSDRHHYYDMNDLTEKVNELMERDELNMSVGVRTIQKDLLVLQCAPFSAPIEMKKVDGRNIYSYSNPSFSLFTKELSDEERHLLHEVLNTLGQFEGLAHFEWLEKFKIGLGFEESRKIISFSNNPYYESSNLLGTLFDQISNEVVVRLSYHTFVDATIRNIVFHPYLLKQYNDRWFLLGVTDDDNKILTFALDRIDKVKPLPGRKYIPCPDNLAEHFDDIVGVTYFEDRPVEHILFWVSDFSKDYVETKPLHGTQTALHGEVETQLRQQYSYLEGGAFYTIDCIKNYELIRLLCSFGKDLIVLQSDGTIVEDIRQRISDMNEKYSMIQQPKL